MRETEQPTVTEIANGEFRLSNKDISIGLIDWGATITSIHMPDRSGKKANIVAGYANLKDYEHNEYYFGSVIGRVANRIAGGRFTLHGKLQQLTVNNDGNHLHGGFKGFNAKQWRVSKQIQEERRSGVVFAYRSIDGEEGYPGNLDVVLQYLLDDSNKLHIDYTAVTDRSTPVNLTNHSYFNLSGFAEPTILDHLLRIHSHQYTEKGPGNTPTGRIVAADKALDFSTAKPVKQDIAAMKEDRGYDHNYVLQQAAEPMLAAELYHRASGRNLRVYTDTPGMQLYTSNGWDGHIRGEQGVLYQQYGALALETQYHPDSVNHSNFPSTILEPGHTYRSSTIFEFAVNQAL